MRSPLRFRRSVLVLLVGPLVGVGHFLLVYVLAEVACAAGWLRQEVFGMSMLALVTAALTAVAAAAIAAQAIIGGRRTKPVDQDLLFTGRILSATFLLAVLFVGIPPLFLGPC